MENNNLSRKTRVIWSAEIDSLPSDPIKLIEKTQLSCMRLITRLNQIEQLKTVLNKIKDRPAKLKEVPLTFMVDLYTEDKIVLEGSFEEKDLSVNDEIEIFFNQKDKPYSIETSNLEMFHEKTLVFLGQGAIVLESEIHADQKIKCRVIQAGTLSSKMEVSVPSSKNDLIFSDAVVSALEAIGKLGVDFLSVNGVSTLKIAKELNSHIEKMEYSPWHLLKVNSKQILMNLEGILPAVSGVAIGRTELALSMGPANVPLISKDIIHTCNDFSKMIFVASDILKSMRHNATPTRAEVSDIGNAVYDGADGVILSEEIALGSYSARSIEVAKKTIDDVELHSSTLEPLWEKISPKAEVVLSAITYGAYKTASRNGAKAIVCLTKYGNTALHLSSFRSDTPVIAITFTREVQKKLNLLRGVESFTLPSKPKMDELLQETNQILKQKTWLEAGDKYVFVSVSLSQIGNDSSNLFTIQSIR